ncbi:glutathione peroxidase [Paenibacillus physcomitrellae]|uniref:Glutathione peroxidase n=1 Tax=Paenibacillus physcomitrellae TaxID=1619311 RepID=A0ABQ1FMA6_9BACL|nr:glutathione peroxidase [Paenibacillus physcomitrellae]GGA21306.1 glutathione peroxidase [Paenibacillus physcomitrellae]
MNIYDFEVKNVNGESARLSRYSGKVLLIVNTASQCSYSRQFAGLQELYETYRDQGLEVLGFPCNQFNNKEPGSGAEAETHCRINHGVTFPIFEKVEVRGASTHPLFTFLTGRAPFQGFDTETPEGKWMRDFLQEKYPELYSGDGIKWNFTKFLIGRKGEVVERFETTVEPADIAAAVRGLL